MFLRILVQLLRGLLQRDPDKRLGSGAAGVAEVKKQKFFRSISWGNAADRSKFAAMQLYRQGVLKKKGGGCHLCTSALLCERNTRARA